MEIAIAGYFVRQITCGAWEVAACAMIFSSGKTSTKPEFYKSRLNSWQNVALFILDTSLITVSMVWSIKTKILC
jgi:hypothetical protein